MPVRVTRSASVRRFSELMHAIGLIAQALDSAWELIDAADDARSASRWSIADAEDLQQAHARVWDCLDWVRITAKNHEVELISREWRR